MQARAIALLLSGMLLGCGEEKDTGGTVSDLDGDGYTEPDDCDDSDDSVHPGAEETWYDGVDADCAGDSDYDADQDGFDADDYEGTDCDDTDASVHPGAEEVWYDGVDQDCDNRDDDQDQDGFDVDEDCDDEDADIWPGAAETWYDGVDSDCAGDDDYDADTDGYASEDYDGTDCDDTDASVHPDAEETWYDGVDADCAGDDDYDADGDGYACEPGSGPDCPSTSDGTDCNDQDPDAYEGADEILDGVDNDCDGTGDAWSVEGNYTGAAIYGTDASDAAGVTLTAEGDYDGDGLDDLMVATAQDDGVSGAGDGVVYLVYGMNVAEGTTTFDDADAMLLTTGSSGPVGAVARLGDQDGDALDEVMVGLPDATSFGQALGSVALFTGDDLGTLAGELEPDASLSDAWATIEGVEVGTELGQALTSAADIDGDGYEDLLVGAPGADEGSGTAWVFTSGVLGGGSLTTDSARAYPGSTDEAAGSALAGLGDLDGDGYGDFAVGAPGTGEGTVYVVQGSALEPRDSLEDEALAIVTGNSDESAFGYALGAADIDGDGTPDLVASAPWETTQLGVVYVLDGATLQAGGTLDAESVRLVSYVGTTNYGHAGATLGTPADVDGDGLPDLVVGGTGDSDGGDDAGTVYLMISGATGSKSFSLSDATFTGGSDNDAAGSGLSTGDIDGDGWFDLVLGVPGEDVSMSDEGAVYVVFSGY